MDKSSACETAPQEPAQGCDLAKSGARIFLWYPPMALALAGFALWPWRWALWTTAFLWAGAACCVNARKCGRVHCTFTGPLYLALAAACAAVAAGWFSVQWFWIWIGAIAGTLLSFMPEWQGRVYWSCGPTQKSGVS